MTIIQVNLCQPATQVNNWSILSEENITVCVPLRVDNGEDTKVLLSGGVIYAVIITTLSK